MKKIILIISLIFLFISCESNLGSKEKTSPNPDPSLIGNWSGSENGDYISSIGEFEYFNYYSYSFNDQNLIKYYSTRTEYGIKMKTYTFTYIWKIENGKSYYKLYNNQFSDWKEFKIEKIDNNNIIIDGIKLSKS